MIQVSNEELIKLSFAPAYIEELSGNRVHVATLYRWRSKGIAGVRLETIDIGGSPFTSKEALSRFFQQSTAAKQNRKLRAKDAVSVHEARLDAVAKDLGI